jgi:hypothetical protein
MHLATREHDCACVQAFRSKTSDTRCRLTKIHQTIGTTLSATTDVRAYPKTILVATLAKPSLADVQLDTKILGSPVDTGNGSDSTFQAGPFDTASALSERSTNSDRLEFFRQGYNIRSE